MNFDVWLTIVGGAVILSATGGVIDALDRWRAGASRRTAEYERQLNEAVQRYAAEAAAAKAQQCKPCDGQLRKSLVGRNGLLVVVPSKDAGEAKARLFTDRVDDSIFAGTEDSLAPFTPLVVSVPDPSKVAHVKFDRQAPRGGRFFADAAEAKQWVREAGGGVVRRVERLRNHEAGAEGYLAFGPGEEPRYPHDWTPAKIEDGAVGTGKIEVVTEVPADPDPDTLYLIDWGSSQTMGGRQPRTKAKPAPPRERRSRRRERQRREKHIRAWLLAERSWRDAQTMARADAQNEAFLAGDPYGLFGDYPPAAEFQRPALPEGEWH